MKLSFEILEHIFSFLVSHEQILITCSMDPLLSPIVERHLYYFITVHFDNWDTREEVIYDHFGPVGLSRIISKNPRILHYVRILQINIPLQLSYSSDSDRNLEKRLDEFAETLLMFPALECIKLTSSKEYLFVWPDVFRAALEDRLSLPTLKELHVEGNQEFPCYLIDNRKNINKVSFSAQYLDATHPNCCSNLPQLKSLALLSYPFYLSITPSIKHHINELQSLKCASSAVKYLPELLGMCSQTLKKLDIDLFYSFYSSRYMFHTGEVDSSHMPPLAPIPRHLQQLIIRATVDVDNHSERDDDRQMRRRKSELPAAAEIINAFVPPPQHLILEIDISLAHKASDLAEVEFYPLAVLGNASLSIPRIDLYVHTGALTPADTHAQFLSSLAGYEGVIRSIREGKLVVHAEETAPDYERGRF